MSTTTSTYLSGCSGKTAYRTAAEAIRRGSHVRRTGRVLRPYLCKCCNMWHLTNRRAEPPKPQIECTAP